MRNFCFCKLSDKTKIKLVYEKFNKADMHVSPTRFMYKKDKYRVK